MKIFEDLKSPHIASVLKKIQGEYFSMLITHQQNPTEM